jgi:NAD(P)H dehydrogenase (quinone)
VHDGEATFGKTKAAVTSLRAAYFMENIGGSLFALDKGLYPTFLTVDHAIPMVATKDIGLTAAKLLLEGGKGKRVVELSGPKEYTQHDVAASLTRVLGKKIEAQQGPIEAMKAALQGAGLSAEWAANYEEMTRGANSGHVAWEGGHAQVRGSTPLDEVVAQLVKK